MSAWSVLVLAGVGSFAFRYVVVAVIDRWSVPSGFERATQFVIPASFSGVCALAIVGPAVTGPGPALGAAAVVTTGVARRRSAASAVVAGMLTMWCVQLLGTAV